MFRWGELSASVTSASITSLLDALCKQGVMLREIKYIDDLNLELKVNVDDYRTLRKLARKRGDEVRLLHTSGGYYIIKKCLKRPVMLIFLIFWLFLVLFLPGRILFFQVEGNKQLSDYEILSAAQQCGVGFGASRRHVKSEKVKNSLLSQIPQLKWIGVNTKGCVATISVKEGVVPKRNSDRDNFGNLVASRDCVITEITVTEGNTLCKVGQAVRKGQVLVSGFTDCGLYVKSGVVKGEVFGITKRELSAISICPDHILGEMSNEKTSYSLQIGKNIINLKKCSGILGAGCVKMYEKNDLTLPGGFRLPISLIKETVIAYETEQYNAYEEMEFNWVEDAVKRLCAESMVAGEILHGASSGTMNENYYTYSGNFVCKEMISKLRTEELLVTNGKRNS